MKEKANGILPLELHKIEVLANDLKDAIRKLKPEIKFKFTKYRKSTDYKILRKEILRVTGTDISNSTLCNLIQNEHNGNMTTTIFNSISNFIEYVLNYTEKPIEQSILWGPDYGKQPGIFINGIEGKFLPWEKLKQEIEDQVVKGCPRIIPIESKIQILDFYRKSNHIIKVFDNSANIVGDIWLGRDPENNFIHDGLIRIGKAVSDTEWVIFQVYRRYSDDSYRLLKSNI